MIPIMVDKNGLINFLINVKDKSDHHIAFEVYEVVSWNGEDDTPYEKELYLEGTVKWDGCSHVWFGEKDEKGNQDGYLHLCGKYYWDLHSELMTKVYDYAANNIPRYNPEVAE
jgi:hypothetical protein